MSCWQETSAKFAQQHFQEIATSIDETSVGSITECGILIKHALLFGTLIKPKKWSMQHSSMSSPEVHLKALADFEQHYGLCDTGIIGRINLCNSRSDGVFGSNVTVGVINTKSNTIIPRNFKPCQCVIDDLKYILWLSSINSSCET